MNRRPSVHVRAAVLLGVTALSPFLLTGCSESEAASPSKGNGSAVEAPADSGAGSTEDELQDAQLESGVPVECVEAFPVAFGTPDLASVTLLPADWPTEAVEGTLCQTAATGDGVQAVDWATDASGTEVLDAIEAALPAGYSVTREDKGMGEQLDGAAGDVYFTVITRPGAYTVQLAAS